MINCWVSFMLKNSSKCFSLIALKLSIIVPLLGNRMNKTIIISLLAIGLLSSCAVQTVCPAYRSAFVLDQDEQDDIYSLFTEVEGDIVPKRPVGFRYKAEPSDTLMEKFTKGTSGRGFRVQGGRIHAQEKAGFTYDNRKNEKLWAKVFQGREKPVLENPYLFDRITKKRPFYKLDGLENKLIHFNATAYQALLKETLNRFDTTKHTRLMEAMASYPTAIQVQYAPLLRGGFNVEQEAYNKRFQEYFLTIEEAVVVDPLDTMGLMNFQYDTLSADSTAEKKGLFGLFKKKNKVPKSKKEKMKKSKEENEAGVLEEEIG